jgi:hypothetical protein
VFEKTVFDPPIWFFSGWTITKLLVVDQRIKRTQFSDQKNITHGKISKPKHRIIM